MNLYAHTLHSAKSVTHVAHGRFLAPNSDDFAVVRGAAEIELWSAAANGDVRRVCARPLFSEVRALAATRPPGFDRDLLFAASDAGRLTALAWECGGPRALLNEPLGKSGLGRASLGWKLRAEPRGRAVALAALQQAKTAFLLSRSAECALVASSPIEAVEAGAVCLELEWLSVGFDNPAFVSLEQRLDDGRRSAVRYTLDVGLGQLVREKCVALDAPFRFVLNDCAGAFWLLGDRTLIRCNAELERESEFEAPIRIDDPNAKAKPQIICATRIRERKKRVFVAQNEFGDLFRVDESGFAYLFTAPIAVAMAHSRGGCLLLAADGGESPFYRLKLESGAESPYFPKPKPTETALLHSISSFAAIVDAKYEDLLGDEVGQTYVLSAGANGSALRALSTALPLELLVAAPAQSVQPRGVWALSARGEPNGNTRYLLLGLPGRTKVLEVGQCIQEARENPGFCCERETLWAGAGGDGWVQATTGEIRVLGVGGRVCEWRLEAGRQALRAAAQGAELALALSSQEIVWLVDERGELFEIGRFALGAEANCLAFAGNCLVVGCADNTLRVLGLDRRTGIAQLFVQALSSRLESVAAIDNAIFGGLSSGQLLRAQLDSLLGTLSLIELENLRSRVPFALSVLHVDGPWLALAGTQTWLGRVGARGFRLRSLALKERMRAVCVATEGDERRLVFVSDGGALSVWRLRDFQSDFSMRELALSLCARKLIIDKENLSLIVLMSQNGVYSAANIERKLNRLNAKDSFDRTRANRSLCRFSPKATRWRSALQFISPKTLSAFHTIEFDENEHATDAALATFAESAETVFLLVAVAQSHNLENGLCARAGVRTFVLESDARQTRQLHFTAFDKTVYAICPFRDRVLLGCEGHLRLYDLGKRQLLKKAEYKHRFTLICRLRAANNARIFLGDAASSAHLLRFAEGDAQFHETVDDVLPRYLTAMEALDYHTLAVADKFGNVAVLRVPPAAEEELRDAAVYNPKWENGYLNGAPHKFEQICCFYVGATPTSLARAAALRKGGEALLCAAADGALRLFVPLRHKAQLDFFRHVELALRSADGFDFLTQRDHLSYRSLYGAVRGVVDGDLCESFIAMSALERKAIAEKLEIGEREIENRISNIVFGIK